MNKIFVIGNLTADPELGESAGGKSFSRFSLACNRVGSDQTDFIPCVAFGKTAENIATYMKKGNKLAVGGTLTVSSYTANDGSKKTSFSVNVAEAEFLTNRQREDSAEGETHSAPTARKPKTAKQPSLEQIFDPDGDDPF